MISNMLDHQLVLYILIPLLSALIAAASFSLVASRYIALISFSFNLLISINAPNPVMEYNIGGWSNYIGINLFSPFASVNLIILVNLVFLLTISLCYADLEKYIKDNYSQSWQHLLYSLFLCLNSAFLGMLVTQDFFNLYVFIEIASLSSYALLSIGKSNKSLVYSLDYLIVGTVGATMILIGIGIILQSNGTLNMVDARSNITSSRVFALAIVFYIVGSLLKIAFFPIHNWMIRAYQNTLAPILMVIGTLSSVIYVYVLYILINFFLATKGEILEVGNNFLYYLSGFSAILFAAIAATQNNFRKVILFSSTIYASYCVMMIISGVAYITISYYLIIICSIKFGLFYIIHLFETQNVDLNLHYSNYLPKTGKFFISCLTLLLISNAGLPISTGFVAKLLLLKALSTQKLYFGLVSIIISSAIALIYNYRILVRFLRISESKTCMKFNYIQHITLLVIGISQIASIFVQGNILEFLQYLSLMNNDILIFASLIIMLVSIILLSSFINRYIVRLAVLACTTCLFLLVVISICYSYDLLGLHMPVILLQYSVLGINLIDLAVDTYSAIFILLLSIVWPISITYSNAYLYTNKEKCQRQFIFFMNLSVLSSFMIALSGNLITMFSFYEILSLSTIPLIIHSGTDHAYRSLRKYLLYLLMPSTLLFLMAIFLVDSISGNITLEVAGGVLKDTTAPSLLVLMTLILFILGVSKVASLPFCFWLPAAMVALHPVSALLHAVAVVNAGIFCLVKIVVYIYGTDYLKALHCTEYLILIPALTIIFASIKAMYQDSIKKILAFSTIAQMNWMLIGLLSFTKIGVMGSVTQMLSHSLTKLLLFFKAGDIYSVTKQNRLVDCVGTFARLKTTYVIIFIAIISLSSFPIFASYFSKILIAKSISDVGFDISWVVKIASVVTMVYLYRILYYMQQDGSGKNHIFHIISKIQLYSSFIVLLLILVLSIIFDLIFNIPYSIIIKDLMQLSLLYILVALLFASKYRICILDFIDNSFSLNKHINATRLKMHYWIEQSEIYCFNNMINRIYTIINPQQLNFTLYTSFILFILLALAI